MPTFEVEVNGATFEVDAPDEQSAAYAAAQMQPGSGAATFAGSSEPVSVGQERAIRGMGGIRTDFPTGSADNPRFETPDSGVSEFGYTIDRQGRTVGPAPEPISQTLMGAGNRLINPIGYKMGMGPQSGRVDAAESGLTSGLLLGGKNEIGAGIEALPGLLDGSYSERFGERLAERDAEDRQLRETHPFSYYGGGAAGTAMGAALMPEVKGATAAIRAGKGALYNAPMGATAGFLATDGDIGDRAAAAAGGAGFGATLGALGGAIPRKTAAAPSELLPPSPPEAAPRVSRRAIGYAKRQSSVSPEELAALQTDTPFMAAEVMGRRGMTALAALARREGQTGDALQGVLTARSIDRPQRLLEGFEQATGVAPEAALGDVEALAAKQRAAAQPLYEEAYAQPFAPQSDKLDVLMTRPSMKSALNRAYRIAAEEGRDPKALGFDLDETGQNVRISAPSVQTMDYVKRGLDDVLDSYRDPVTKRLNLNTEGRAINDTATAFRAEMKRLSPAYEAALLAGGDAPRTMEAFRDGSNALFSQKMTARQFEDRFARLSDGDKQAWKAGITNAAFQLAQSGRLKPGVFSTPIVRGKLEAALGRDGAASLIDLAKNEDAMRAFEQRYAPGAGSITSEITQAIKEQEATPLLDAGIDAVKSAKEGGLWGTAASLAKSGWNLGGDVYMRRLRGMTPEVSDEAGRILMLPPLDAARALANAPRKKPLVAPIVRQGLSRTGGRLGGLAAAQ